MKTATVSKTGIDFTDYGSRCVTKRDEIALQRDQVQSWTGNRVGLVIEAREGIVWLTQCGDSTDIILGPGQTFRVTHAGQVVVQSLAAVSVLVTS
jgi:hypothetical protein